MDALDEQLAQLKLLNNRSLSPKIAENAGGGGGGGAGGQQSSSPVHTLYKKVGPAVPPKPLKKNISPPQVPQSSVVKQTCEPLYSKRLQVVSKQDQQQPSSKIVVAGGGGGGGGVVAPRKLNHLYSNMKMTLDNPVILDQQLEALEHHKKQLQKKSAGLPQYGSYSSEMSGSGSFDDVVRGNPNNFHVYSNLEQRLPPSSVNSPDVIVYSNIRHQSQQSNDSDGCNSRGTENIVYSNVGFDELLPPPPPLDIPPAPLNLSMGGAAASTNFDYLHQTSEEDLPPPPSPVSSSYSELRRATDNFPQMPQYPIYMSNGSSGTVGGNGAKQQQLHQQSTAGSNQGGIIGSTSSNIGGSSSNLDDDLHHLQQTYVNTQYQNDYNAYEPSSRSLSNSSSDYYGYGDLSQSSSTYESIYEPINPRPPSQLSSRSNYSLYTSYVNGSQSTGAGSNTPSIGGGGNIPSSGSSNGGGGVGGSGGGGGVGSGSSGGSSKLPSHKEAEVEALTNLLVHSMDGGSDVDNYGICVKCGERVVGESSGCTAMEQIYHIICFTCSQCQINLQGKPFYALEGKPYCEDDYLNTLEKCSVCMKPILERILRATGKPFHPGCFCCVVCGNSLDGIPFTVDATNQNYCIEDFHKKFAPRCCVCRQPIMPEPGQEETVRVVALDRSFHFECYKCEDCGLLLSSEAEGRGCYPLDDHVLCKSCNAKRVQALTSRMTTEL